MNAELVRNSWRLPGRATRTTLLADALDRRLLEGRALEDLPRACRFTFNAANVTTGVRFGLEADRVGDYVMGTVSTTGSGISLSRAVAASAAVPGFFPALVLNGLAFPCGNGLPAKLLDGGAYDNRGLEPIDDLPKAVHGGAQRRGHLPGRRLRWAAPGARPAAGQLPPLPPVHGAAHALDG